MGESLEKQMLVLPNAVKHLKKKKNGKYGWTLLIEYLLERDQKFTVDVIWCLKILSCVSLKKYSLKCLLFSFEMKQIK